VASSLSKVGLPPFLLLAAIFFPFPLLGLFVPVQGAPFRLRWFSLLLSLTAEARFSLLSPLSLVLGESTGPGLSFDIAKEPYDRLEASLAICVQRGIVSRDYEPFPPPSVRLHPPVFVLSSRFLGVVPCPASRSSCVGFGERRLFLL